MWKSILILCLLSQLLGSIRGGVFLTSESGNIFYVENELKVNWYEAIGICLKKNMSLIRPDTLEKNMEITKLISDFEVRESFWTAGQEVNDFTYVWITTGNKVSWTNWNSDEPDREDSGETQCIGFFIDEWFSYTCAESKNFICEENPLVKNIKIKSNSICHNENEEVMDNRSKSQSHNFDALGEKTEELKNLQKEYEQMQNQLILVKKGLEWKSQEIEMLTKFHEREIQLLEEKLSLVGNCTVRHDES